MEPIVWNLGSIWKEKGRINEKQGLDQRIPPFKSCTLEEVQEYSANRNFPRCLTLLNNLHNYSFFTGSNYWCFESVRFNVTFLSCSKWCDKPDGVLTGYLSWQHGLKSSPLGIPLFGPSRKRVIFTNDKSFIDQVCSMLSSFNWYRRKIYRSASISSNLDLTPGQLITHIDFFFLSYVQ